MPTAKIFSACPGSRVLECLKLLRTVLQGRYLPHSVTREQHQDPTHSSLLRQDATSDPSVVWFFKTQYHAGTRLVTAQSVSRMLMKSQQSQAIATKLLTRPWLYNGRSTAARLYVAVSNAPLRVYVATHVTIVVAPMPYDVDNPCSLVTNLWSKRMPGCRNGVKYQYHAARGTDPVKGHKAEEGQSTTLILKWFPTDAKDHQPDSTITNVLKGNTLEYRQVVLAPKLWSNMLKLMRAVFLKVEANSSATNQQV